MKGRFKLDQVCIYKLFVSGILLTFQFIAISEICCPLGDGELVVQMVLKLVLGPLLELELEQETVGVLELQKQLEQLT